MMCLISQVTFVTQISSHFHQILRSYFKINLRRLLLEDNFLAHKKCIFLNMPEKLVLRIRNFVKMQGKLWKMSFSLPAFLKILDFHNFKIFLKTVFWEHQFSNKNQKVSIMLTFMNSKLPDDRQISDKQYHILEKVNPMKYGI